MIGIELLVITAKIFVGKMFLGSKRSQQTYALSSCRHYWSPTQFNGFCVSNEHLKTASQSYIVGTTALDQWFEAQILVSMTCELNRSSVFGKISKLANYAIDIIHSVFIYSTSCPSKLVLLLYSEELFNWQERKKWNSFNTTLRKDIHMPGLWTCCSCTMA